MTTVKKTTSTKTELSSEIDLEIPNSVSRSARKRLKEEAGELILDTILERVGNAKSPLKDNTFPKLTPEYAKFKKKEGRGTKANLELFGDMLDSLNVVNTRDGVKIQIKGNQAPKADGHNNFSGDSKLPRRRFIPKQGDKFIPTLESDIKSIISEAVVSSVKVKKSDLSDISSRTDLNSLIGDMFPELTVRAAKAAILADEDLLDVFADVLDLF